MIRLYQRKALQGWYSNVLRKQHQRAVLLHAAQNIMFGMLARTFLAWLGFVTERRAKQVVFAQKQRALSEALKFGERVRLRQNAELIVAVFQAWRFKVTRATCRLTDLSSVRGLPQHQLCCAHAFQ
jgi:hypothetical protein